LLAKLRHAGVAALKGAGLVCTTTFAAAVPDQCEWVERLLKKSDRERASSEQPSGPAVQCRSSLAAFLKYANLGQQPPEYSTMYLCIWGSSNLPEHLFREFEERQDEARAKVLQYREQHGMWPHPLTLLGVLEEGRAAPQQAAALAQKAKNCLKRPSSSSN
jgi:hypothetical protein